MKKIRWFVLPLGLLLLFTLAACGENDKIAEGVKEMNEALEEVKEQVEDNDAKMAKVEYDELHEAWEDFEDEVKEQNKELYEEIEAPLFAIKAGVSQETLDPQALNGAIAELEAALEKLNSIIE